MKKAAVRKTGNGAGRRKAKPEPPIWEKIRTIFADVPKSEWKKVPKDLATNLDHYLYGFPKRH